MDGVHVVDERLHRLVDAVDGLVDGMLQIAFASRQPVEILLQIVVECHII